MKTIKLKCKNCNVEFERYIAEYNNQLKKGQTNFFCGRSCLMTFFQSEKAANRKREYELDPKKCKTCHSIISFETRLSKKIYCSRKCSYLDNQKSILDGRIKHGKFRQKQCRMCENNTKNTYCSHKCELEYKKMAMVEKLKSGDWSTSVWYSSTLKKTLSHIRGESCESCHLVKWTLTSPTGSIIEKKIPLTLHHIDGNSGNNKLENLQLLCWNCHSLTDNFGSKNRNCVRRKAKSYSGNIGLS